MKRRMAVKGIVAIATSSVALTTLACAESTSYALRALAQPQLLALLGADETRAVGQRYLALTPNERDAVTLRRAIEASARRTTRFPWQPLPEVATLITDDFAHDRVVYPNGWVLSITEARQCALFALSAT